MDTTDWTMQIAAIPANNARVETAAVYANPGTNGAVPLRADGKEMRLALRMPQAASWQRAVGAQVTYRASGRR